MVYFLALFCELEALQSDQSTPHAGSMLNTRHALSLVPALICLGQHTSHSIIFRQTLCVYIYIICVHHVALRTLKLLCACPHFHSLRHHTMPVRGQRSQAAKQKQHQGLSVFAKQANAQSTPSPDGSVYYLSDGNTDMSTTVTDSSSGGSRNNQAATSREGLQRLYLVFLP